MMNDWFGTKDRKMNEELLESLPENPKPGSYYWWAKHVTREYTGAHFLDSGGAYGRMHSRPVPSPVEGWVSIWDGKVEYAVTNLTAFLASRFDPSTADAQACDTVLRWLSASFYRDDVARCFMDLMSDLEAAVERDADGWVKVINADEIRNSLDHIFVGSGGNEWNAPMNVNDLDEIMKAMGEPEIEALLHILNNCDIKGEKLGFYTYNHENTLNQDFRIYGLLANVFAISSHNGTDARTGFSNWRAAELRDNFDEYDIHYYNARLEGDDEWDEVHASENGVNLDLVRRYTAWFAAQHVDPAQLDMFDVFDMPAEWPDDWPQQHVAQAMVDHLTAACLAAREFRAEHLGLDIEEVGLTQEDEEEIMDEWPEVCWVERDEDGNWRAKLVTDNCLVPHENALVWSSKHQDYVLELYVDFDLGPELIQ